MERLKKTKASFEPAQTAQTPKPLANKNTATSPATDTKPTSIFYGNETNQKAEALNQYENKLKHHPSHSSSNRIMSQPYPKRDGNVMTKTVQPTNTNNSSNSAQKFCSIFKKVISCTCSMISSTRFQVTESGYSDKLIEIYKSIPTRAFSKYFMEKRRFVVHSCAYSHVLVSFYRSTEKDLVVRFERL